MATMEYSSQESRPIFRKGNTLSSMMMRVKSRLDRSLIKYGQVKLTTLTHSSIMDDECVTLTLDFFILGQRSAFTLALVTKEKK